MDYLNEKLKKKIKTIAPEAKTVAKAVPAMPAPKIAPAPKMAAKKKDLTETEMTAITELLNDLMKSKTEFITDKRSLYSAARKKNGLVTMDIMELFWRKDPISHIKDMKGYNS